VPDAVGACVRVDDLVCEVEAVADRLGVSLELGDCIWDGVTYWDALDEDDRLSVLEELDETVELAVEDRLPDADGASE
jgi:hypothetical protein